MPTVSLLATLVGALAGFALGGVWYGPLFGRAWMAEHGFVAEDLQRNFNPAKTYGIMLVLALIAAYVFGMFIGPDPGLGFAAATGDVVLYTDADLPFDMDELPRAVRLLRDYDVDIISAYRFDRTGEGSLRAVYTFVYNGLIRALFGLKVRDINFAFKLCRRRIFEHVQLKSEGSFIDAELVIRATRMGYEIMQMGVDYFPRTRGESTLSSPGVIVKILKEMWSLRADLRGIQKVR